MDILLKKENIIINIEMNQEVKDFTKRKNITYFYRLSGNQYEEGDKYTKYYVTQINFNNSYSSLGKNIPIIKAYLADVEQMEKIDDSIMYCEIPLLNYKKICYHKNNFKETALSMFTAESMDELKKITNGNEEMNVIVDEIERLNRDKYF